MILTNPNDIKSKYSKVAERLRKSINTNEKLRKIIPLNSVPATPTITPTMVNLIAQISEVARFMPHRIFEAITTFAPQVSPQVDPQVERLLAAIHGEMTALDFLKALNLRDRKSFRLRYFEPALKEGLIEMTIPDSPIDVCRNIVQPVKGGASEKK